MALRHRSILAHATPPAAGGQPPILALATLVSGHFPSGKRRRRASAPQPSCRCGAVPIVLDLLASSPLGCCRRLRVTLDLGTCCRVRERKMAQAPDGKGGSCIGSHLHRLQKLDCSSGVSAALISTVL